MLNIAGLQPVLAHVNLYDREGGLVRAFEIELPVRNASTSPVLAESDGFRGWVEVVADGEILVDGTVDTVIEHSSQGFFSGSSRAMTWYRVDSE